MSLSTVFFTWLIVGLIVYLVNRFWPMPAEYKKAFSLVVLLLLLLWTIGGVTGRIPDPFIHIR